MQHELLSKQLDAIEVELLRLGYMKNEERKPAAVRSAFGQDEMPFEHWLSLVFLPSARDAVASKRLPKKSQVGIAAIRNFDGHSEAETLVSLLCQFDQEVERVSRIRSSGK